ncbi:hypothetical protein TSUD_40080 [Trifolium subterraneum]|uniref:SUZ domain-containing protein n=1 Tax=Trifolium subterraneum TaxID=3900 RepID=A0A2Z6MWU6_TRISU|nr:hypothetical protein TSUD_40080 [Trifolium subterraneum]
MEGSSDDLGAPESWEVADLDDSMNRLNLLISSNKDSKPHDHAADVASVHPPPPSSSSATGDKVFDDAVNLVDQFLREAIQNPRERLSILRIEQDVLNLIQDPNQQQIEFNQLPTSYLRLAAHRVAQHYSLQSMVLMDNNSLPDGSGSTIIVRKTAECKLPVIRLADIPVKLPSENNAVMKVAIKPRPQKQSQILNNANSNSGKKNSSKSVEERKEEYNRARARIFNSTNNGGTVGGKPECETRQQDNSFNGSSGFTRGEDKYASVSDVSSSRGMIGSSTNTGRGLIESSPYTSRGLVEPSTNTSRGLVDTSTNTSRGLVDTSTNTSRARSRTEKESVGRYRQSNRVAIFRDREIDRKDPDYDRSYDRYMQRFDPGFGFNGGSYPMQPMYAPVLNYNTEFPQLGSPHGPQRPAEHQPRPLPQHISGQHISGTWVAQSTPAGMGYGHPEAMMSPFSPNQVGAHSSSTMYLHSSQYPCQHPGMPFIHPEHIHQPFAQVYAATKSPICEL